MDELVGRIRQAADEAGEAHFLELLRWHRVVAGLPEPDWGARGAYQLAVTQLGEDRADELLHDLRRLARNPRRYRNGADGKPRYRHERTSSAAAGRRRNPPGSTANSTPPAGRTDLIGRIPAQ